jgi:hypothetical protein
MLQQPSDERNERIREFFCVLLLVCGGPDRALGVDNPLVHWSAKAVLGSILRDRLPRFDPPPIAPCPVYCAAPVCLTPRGRREVVEQTRVSTAEITPDLYGRAVYWGARGVEKNDVLLETVSYMGSALFHGPVLGRPLSGAEGSGCPRDERWLRLRSATGRLHPAIGRGGVSTYETSSSRPMERSER